VHILTTGIPVLYGLGRLLSREEPHTQPEGPPIQKSKLNVDDMVYMSNGKRGDWATVIEITATGVTVRSYKGHDLWHFDNDCLSTDVDTVFPDRRFKLCCIGVVMPKHR
jgi:hypothetical protein